MNEDAQRNREGCGAENLAQMRRLALNIARSAPGRDLVRGRLKKAARRNENLIKLVCEANRLPKTAS